MAALAARAAPARAAETNGALWLPMGRATVPLMGPAPPLTQYFVGDKTPDPLTNPQWIEVLRSLPM